jgi:ADP-dependent NAD(P)H-hydrate dehydratase / NAD(P)H-hydrate epimerase
MLRAHTAAAIRAAEQPLLDAGHGPALMQRAAHGLAQGVVGVLRGRGLRVYGSRVVILAGAGNNGGDALYAGAALAARGARTTALLTSARTHPEALAAFRRAGGRVAELADTHEFLAEAALADVLVDGILGTGGRGGLREPVAGVVAHLRRAVADGDGPAVVACDLPSGVDATTGEVHEPVLRADLTVTFGAAKTGLFTAPGEQLCGAVQVVDIGIGQLLGEPDVYRLEATDLAALLPVPAAADHKYTRGVAGIVAGSANYPGAALLAVAAASACGPGMVRYLGPGSVAAALHLRNPEVVCSTGPVADARVQAWLAGPGIDGSSSQLARAHDAIHAGQPVAVDAGALPLVADTVRSGGKMQPSTVLTPHAGELATLLTQCGQAITREQVEAQPLAAARTAAALTGATVLVKGPTTVVASPTGTVFSQADGTPSLATAGSGDTLAGILVAVLAMVAGRPAWGIPELAPEDKWATAAALAAALHGRLGRTNPGGPLNAGELAARIPAVWASLAGTR